MQYIVNFESEYKDVFIESQLFDSNDVFLFYVTNPSNFTIKKEIKHLDIAVRMKHSSLDFNNIDFIKNMQKEKIHISIVYDTEMDVSNYEISINYLLKQNADFECLFPDSVLTNHAIKEMIVKMITQKDVRVKIYNNRLHVK